MGSKLAALDSWMLTLAAGSNVALAAGRQLAKDPASLAVGFLESMASAGERLAASCSRFGRLAAIAGPRQAARAAAIVKSEWAAGGDGRGAMRTMLCVRVASRKRVADRSVACPPGKTLL